MAAPSINPSMLALNRLAVRYDAAQWPSTHQGALFDRCVEFVRERPTVERVAHTDGATQRDPPKAPVDGPWHMTEPRQPTILSIDRLPALLRFWRWRDSLLCALPGWMALAPHMFGWVSGRDGIAMHSALRVPLPLAALVALLGLVVGWWLAGQRFAHYRVELHEGEGVVLRRGVWWRSEVWVPTARLQHLEVQQGPLDRRWGMASLSLYTAGSHDHHTRIIGLPLAQAHALRDQLLPRQAIAHE